MFSEIRLDNFQGFGEATAIPCKPLTLIYGPNASGKSSILRSLLLAKQSMPKDIYSFVGLIGRDGFVYEGDLVSLASFENTVHQHDASRTLGLGFSVKLLRSRASSRNILRSLMINLSADWEVEDSSPFSKVKLRFKFRNFQEPFHEIQESLGIVFDRVMGESGEPTKYLRVSEIDSTQNLITYLDKFVDEVRLAKNPKDPFSETSTPIDSAEACDDGMLNWQPKITFEPSDFSHTKFPISGNLPHVVARNDHGHASLEGPKQRQLEFLAALIQIARSELLENLEDIRHVQSLRAIEERFNYEGDSDVFRDSRKQKNSAKNEEVISNWLSTLTKGRYKYKSISFIAEDVKHFGRMKSHMIIDTLTDTPVSFKDVGVGLSQVKPILEVLSSVNDQRRVTLLVEQPELHLHPGMQADIASLFTAFVAENLGSQIIAETHSEAILLRVQKEMRAGVLDPNDVQIIYVDQTYNPDSPGNSIQSFSFDEENGFDFELPLSFTELRFRESI